MKSASNAALVITSIAGSDHPIIARFAGECATRKIPFYLIGDVASPANFNLDGCQFHSIDAQRKSGFRIVEKLPERHYGRKNVGYLLAIRDGANILIETDDDNIPLASFWAPRSRSAAAHRIEGTGWTNVYRYFTRLHIWPRGFPLEHLADPLAPLPEQQTAPLDCPIQQGLADDNPDIDAVYRLVLPLPARFETRARIALGRGTWCPFNSQNTTWFRDAFPLLYLPSHCSFRMTDIWRSFVAQRIAWENEWYVLFHEPTVRQERNTHNLLRDFADEIPGYLQNAAIARALATLPLDRGLDAISANLRACYRALVEMGAVGADELPLLDAWLTDLAGLGA